MAISGYRRKVSLRNYIGRRCNFVAWGSGCSLLMNWGGVLTVGIKPNEWDTTVLDITRLGVRDEKF